MKNNFRKFQKTPLFFSLIFLAASVACFVFIYKNIQSSNAQFQEVQTKWQTENSKREGIKSLQNALKMSEDSIAMLDTHFIESSDVVPLLDSIEKGAKAVNAEGEVTLINITPDNTSLLIGVKAKGSFENLYKFITLLENSPYQLDFISISIQKDLSPTATGSQWVADIKLKLLSFVN